MRSGQSSVDLMLALLFAVAFFSVLAILNQNYERDIKESAIKGGLQAILADVYTATASAKAYDLNINYASPELRTGQSTKAEDCKIKFRDSGPNTDINVISGTLGKAYTGIELTDTLFNGKLISSYGGTLILNCGTKFTIEKA